MTRILGRLDRDGRGDHWISALLTEVRTNGPEGRQEWQDRIEVGLDADPDPIARFAGSGDRIAGQIDAGIGRDGQALDQALRGGDHGEGLRGSLPIAGHGMDAGLQGRGRDGRIPTAPLKVEDTTAASQWTIHDEHHQEEDDGTERLYRQDPGPAPVDVRGSWSQPVTMRVPGVRFQPRFETTQGRPMGIVPSHWFGVGQGFLEPNNE